MRALTEAKAAELVASEARYRRLAAATFEGIIFSADGRLVDFNDQLLGMLGYRREELIGMAIADLLPAEDRARVLANIEQGSESRIEHEIIRKDGLRLQVEAHGQCFDNGHTRITALRDISERKALEASLIEARNQAQRQARAKSDFLTFMSHEIRTPLHVIIGLGQLLSREITNPGHRQKLAQLCANSDHLLAVINEFLDLSKIEARQFVLESKDFCLNQMIAQVVRMIEGPAADKGLQLTVDLPPQLDDISLRGDALRLAQILINLCSNAIKFTAVGAIKLQISHLGEVGDGVRLRFVVSDSGCGISQADQARLFEAFSQFSAEAAHQGDGSGLGLAISQRLVGLMGGRIQVDTRVGEGSRFSFDLTLPYAPARAPNRGEPDSIATEHFNDRIILLVDDHPQSQDITLSMLENLGFSVDVACDGIDALECARGNRYDLILMDLQMPRMDGLAATRAIRRLSRHRDTPIIALTANAFAEDRQRCLDAGMNDHLGKPVTLAQLTATLARWLPGLVTVAAEAPPCDDERVAALAAIAGLTIASAWLSSPVRINVYVAQLARFVEACQIDLPRLHQLVDGEERAAALSLAHSLRGIAGLVGARRLGDWIGELELALSQGGDGVSVGALLRQCDAELGELAAALQGLPSPAGNQAAAQ